MATGVRFLSLSLVLVPMGQSDMVEPVRLLSVWASSEGGAPKLALRDGGMGGAGTRAKPATSELTGGVSAFASP